MEVLFILIFLLTIAIFVIAKLPNMHNTEQAIIIRKALADVRDTVADLHFYPQWSPLELLETKCNIEISGIPKMMGHSCRWKGRKAGKGVITIRAIDDRHVHFDLNIISRKLETRDNWFFEQWGDEDTKVTLQNNGISTFPFARLLSRLIIKRINGQIRSGLTNLKSLCESVNTS